MIFEPIGLCEKCKGGLHKRLKHAQQARNTAFFAGVLIHQYTAEVHKATKPRLGVLMNDLK